VVCLVGWGCFCRLFRDKAARGLQDSAAEVVEDRHIDSVGWEGIDEVAANEASSTRIKRVYSFL
jgi:hypothetical protein